MLARKRASSYGGKSEPPAAVLDEDMAAGLELKDNSLGKKIHIVLKEFALAVDKGGGGRSRRASSELNT